MDVFVVTLQVFPHALDSFIVWVFLHFRSLSAAKYVLLTVIICVKLNRFDTTAAYCCF